ncbi:MAG: glycosyltransferase family 2 protein [candidate division NC10 bacterium]|nr:glycosyltransferase family 2 protein [candidate division NC10 bacterium]
MTDRRPLISIVLPVYNEEAALARDLEAIEQAMRASDYPYEVLVIDDGSTDRSAEIAAAKGARVIHHATNRGYGSAIRTGIREADGQIIVTTDADGSYPHSEIPSLLDRLDRHDLIVGARRSERGSARFLRTPAKRFIRWLACILTRAEIPDLNSGMRAFRKEIAQRYLNLLPPGFSCSATLTMIFLCEGYQVAYVPIDYHPRVGRSKFHPIRDTANFVSLVWRMIFYFNPLRVLGPLSLFLIGLSVAKAIHDLVAYRLHIATSTVLIFSLALQALVIGLVADLIIKRSRSG